MTQPHTIANPNQIPQQRVGDQFELNAQHAVEINPMQPTTGKPEIAAVIQASSDTNAEYHASEGNVVDRLMVVDMRSVPPSNVRGYKLFGEEFVTASADYLLINPAILDFDKGLGFKALRAGESFNYGRPTEQTPKSDKKLRFKGASPATSREHFNITVGAEGSITITDLGSANQTAVLTGQYAQEALKGNERQLHMLAAAPNIGKTVLQQELDNYVAETGTSRATILGHAAVDNLKNQAYNPTQPELSRELLLQYPELAPKGGLRIGNYDFLFSGIVSDESKRKHAIAYVTDEAGKVLPRLFYKSISDGGWRVTPGVYEDTKAYSKGEDSTDGGYVQLTKPLEEITQYLEIMEKQGTIALNMEDVRTLFEIEKQERQGISNFETEVKATRLQGRKSKALYEAYQPGIGFKEDAIRARKHLANIELPKGFEPSFDVIERQYQTTHSLAGNTLFKVYSAQLDGRAVEWHMAASEKGDYWIDKITYKDTAVTTYGTASEPILVGALSAKPYEYQSQLQNMDAGIDYKYIGSNQYASLAPYWSRIPSVKRFKQKQP